MLRSSASTDAIKREKTRSDDVCFAFSLLSPPNSLLGKAIDERGKE